MATQAQRKLALYRVDLLVGCLRLAGACICEMIRNVVIIILKRLYIDRCSAIELEISTIINNE
jgi:hypothetical protein